MKLQTLLSSLGSQHFDLINIKRLSIELHFKIFIEKGTDRFSKKKKIPLLATVFLQLHREHYSKEQIAKVVHTLSDLP